MYNNQKTSGENLQTTSKIKNIIEKEFSREIEKKKEEIFNIYRNLNKATKYLHYLRYSIVNNYFTRPELYDEEVIALSKQVRIHPALVYTTGEESFFPEISTDINLSEHFQESDLSQKRKNSTEFDEVKNKRLKNADSSDNSSIEKTTQKVKKRICIRNISKWISEESKDNEATHKWMIFIEDDTTKKVPEFISKVWYFLHDSYKPHNVIEVTSAPFSLCRLGWGEFPIRVQLHFVNTFDRPVDLIHHLKLDTTHTGKPTLGAETLVDLWIHISDINYSTADELECINNYLSNNENIEHITNKKKEIFLHKDDNGIKLSNQEEKILPIFYSILNDHNYTGDYLNTIKNLNKNICLEKISEFPAYLNNVKTYEKHANASIINGLQNNSPNKLCNFETYFNEEVQLQKLNILNSYESLKIDNILNIFSEKIKNNSIDFKEISNVDITDVYDKKMSNYNCKMIQKEYTKTLVSLVKHAELKTPFDLFKFIIRRMPLITKKATDACYRVLHPYACESFQVFNGYSLGKQRSLEQYRAKHALEILKYAKCDVNDYSVKDFIIWARRYCYTPVINLKHVSYNNKFTPNLFKNQVIKSSFTSNPVNEWLNFIQDSKIQKNFLADEEIDILNIAVKVQNKKEKIEKKKSKMPLIFLNMENDLNKFVYKSVEQYGFVLQSEEVVPNVFQCTASVLLAKAVELLIEDLLRTSFSCAVDECSNKSQELEIKVNNVCSALLKRDEFVYFTNKNLTSNR